MFLFLMAGYSTSAGLQLERGLTECCSAFCLFAVSTDCSCSSGSFDCSGARPFTHLKIYFIKDKCIQFWKLNKLYHLQFCYFIDFWSNIFKACSYNDIKGNDLACLCFRRHLYAGYTRSVFHSDLLDKSKLLTSVYS